MKEHIYRARRKDNGSWIAGYYVHLTNEDGSKKSHRIYTGYVDTDCNKFYPDWAEIDPLTLEE